MPYFAYDDTKMYYETVGEGIPFLIIHGWAIDHRFSCNMMEPVMTKLEAVGKSFTRIYVDVPGMGLSIPGKITNGDGVIDVLDRFMNELFPNQKFFIGGNSFGAAVSRAYAAKHYEKILALMLIVPSTGKLGKTPKVKYAYRDDDFLRKLTPKEKAAFTCMNAVLSEDVWERYREAVYPSVLINENNEFLHKKFRGVFGFDVDAAYAKKTFAAPVLILCGRYDTAVGWEDQKKWLDLYPNAVYEVIEDAGHNIFVDQPEEFERIVYSWLRNL